MATFANMIRRGTRGSQPAASGVGVGTLYHVTDEGVTERSTGSAWESYGGSGTIAQIVNTQTGAMATGTTVVPVDDTIPQNTEGDQYMTLAITPTSATNKLKIDVVFWGTSSQNNWITVALFQDSTANALAAVMNFFLTGSAAPATIAFSHVMTAGTTSATTFKVRAGRDASAAGTVTFNGVGGARFLGGVMASSITITEYVP